MTTKKESLKDAAKVYAKVRFSYNVSYIFPYEDGVALMTHFGNAEQYDDSEYDNHKITPMKASPELTLMSRDEYQKLKTVALLLNEKDDKD